MSSLLTARHSIRRAAQLRAAASTRIASSRSSPRAVPAFAAVDARPYSTMHDNDPAVLEREKHRNLSGTQHHTSTPHEHAPGWNENLASEAEAHVKADKSTGSPEELTSSTLDYLKKRHADDAPAEAKYAKDEIEGPLKSAVSSAASAVNNVLEKTGLKDKKD